jgi:hypothetical protein
MKMNSIRNNLALLNPGQLPRKNKKSQKNKRKCSNNDTHYSEENYLQSFKLIALKSKRAKIGIPTTEVIEKTTVNMMI